MAAKTLDDALALYQSGKSIRECEKLTGINRGKIQREANSRGIKKGEVCQLIEDKARVERDFVSLNVSLQNVVTSEVARINHFKGLRDQAADAAFGRVLSGLGRCENSEVKGLVDSLDRLCITAEIAPRFSNAQTVINNTNAQQNNIPAQISADPIQAAKDYQQLMG